MTAHVLLIDDNPGFTDSIRENFILHAIEIETAGTWDEGVEKFRVGLHELVIADYNLPDSDHGLKLLAKIKPLRPSSELILISGAVTSVPENQIIISGLVDAYFPKKADLPGILLERAKLALERTKQPTNWTKTARAHVAGYEIDEKKIDDIDQLLRKNIKSE